MKVEVSNLGPVHRAEIDLRPFTLFVGPNNAGKTWVAYALYGILGYHGWRRYLEECVEGSSPRYPTLETLVEQVLEKGNTSIDLRGWAEEHTELYINHVAEAFTQRWIGDFMNTQNPTLFADSEIRFPMTSQDREQSLQRIADRTVEAQLSVGREEALLRADKSEGSFVLYFYTEAPRRLVEELPGKAVRRFVMGNIFEILHHSFWANAVPLPVERTAFTALLKASRWQETEGKMGQPVPYRSPFPQPVDDYLSWIGWVYRTAEEEAEMLPERKIYRQLACVLEREILEGEVRFSTPVSEPGREILFYVAERPLELSIASSMVRELSPLLLYLRHYAESGQLLVMDEPEMNLHPEAQARLVEFLAILVRHGLSFLITTHSPYVTDHLNNLMKAATCPDPVSIRDKFLLKNAEAFIPADQVAAYLFDPRDGSVQNILSEGLIDWGTFGEVSDWMGQLYFDLC